MSNNSEKRQEIIFFLGLLLATIVLIFVFCFFYDTAGTKRLVRDIIHMILDWRLTLELIALVLSSTVVAFFFAIVISRRSSKSSCPTRN